MTLGVAAYISPLDRRRPLRSALTFLLLAAANADAQQYDYLTSLQPSLTNSVVTVKTSKAPLRSVQRGHHFANQYPKERALQNDLI
jgi:hypothetical protein